MLDTSTWDGALDNYVDALVWLVEQLLSDPRHFFRSYTTEELARLMTARPDLSSHPRARDMAIYKRYFDLIASGEKTVEVRVGYSSMRRIQPGQLIRFTCRDEACLTRVKRVSNYASFERMFELEDPALVNPTATRAQQLGDIRQIFPPEKEALGVIAIEIERV
jgi:ASC-1-like (ASCH) protein